MKSDMRRKPDALLLLLLLLPVQGTIRSNNVRPSSLSPSSSRRRKGFIRHHVILSSRGGGGGDTKPRVQLTEPLGEGVARDVGNLRRTYASHIMDGFSVKVLSSVCFLFFGCISPAIAFGALCDGVTDGAMGTMEMVLGTAISGMVYALLSGQPLTIVGSTGPVLAMISCIFSSAKALSLPFLPLYAWSGIWSSLILAGVAATSLSNGVEYLSRFTDEIFANLISFIFIYEAFRSLAKTIADPAVPAAQAFLSVLIAFGTFSIAVSLFDLRASKLFRRRTRELSRQRVLQHY